MAAAQARLRGLADARGGGRSGMSGAFAGAHAAAGSGGSGGGAAGRLLGGGVGGVHLPAAGASAAVWSTPTPLSLAESLAAMAQSYHDKAEAVADDVVLGGGASGGVDDGGGSSTGGQGVYLVAAYRHVAEVAGACSDVLCSGGGDGAGAGKPSLDDVVAALCAAR